MTARAEPAEARARAEARRIRWIARVGTWLIRLLGLTWRMRRVNGGDFDRATAEHLPTMFVLWHGQMLPLLFRHRNLGIAVLISEHKDGEIIAQVAERLGFRTVRGSTSRGAGRALIEMSRVLAEGGRVAVTPDGPRGPAKSFAPGALVAAQRARTPLIGLAIAARRAWHLKSWDRFTIPKPFSRVAIAYSAPMRVAGANPREAAEEGERFTAMMEELEALAARAVE